MQVSLKVNLAATKKTVARMDFSSQGAAVLNWRLPRSVDESANRFSVRIHAVSIGRFADGF